MNLAVHLKKIALFLIFAGSASYAASVVLAPTADIAIANSLAMGFNAGGLNNGTNDTLTIVNYKC